MYFFFVIAIVAEAFNIFLLVAVDLKVILSYVNFATNHLLNCIKFF